VDSRILIQLYQDIIRRYPFSITGRPDAEIALADFFARFCRHSIIKERENILFVIALFAELNSLRLDKQNLDLVSSWQTKPLRNLLLFNFEGEYPDLILSFYLTLLHHISGGRDITATNIIAGSVIGDVDLRIKITPFHKPSIHFIEREDVIEFRTPRKIFKKELWDEQKGCLKTGEVRRILQKYLPESSVDSQLIARAAPEKPHVFVIDREKNAFERSNDAGLITTPAVDEIFDQQNLDEIRDAYFEEFERLSKRVLVGKIKDDEHSKDLTWIAIGGAFLAAYYDINLDYVLSVCNISPDELNTLGGLAVGSKRSAPLTLAERALFSMVSDHISANLSAQMMHDLFAVEFMKGRAKYVVRKFVKNTPFRNLTHGQIKKEWAVQALTDFKKGNVAKVISAETTRKLTSYFEEVAKNGELRGEGQEEGRRRSEQIHHMIEFSAQDLWNYIYKKIDTYEDEEIKFVLRPEENNLPNDRLFGDYLWIQEVIELAWNNLITKAFSTPPLAMEPQVKIIISFPDNRSKAAQRGKAAALHCIIEDNGIGCDVYEIPDHGGSYDAFFNRNMSDEQNYRTSLITHGNIIIESKKKKLDFLRPYEKLTSDFERGTRVILKLDCVIENV
jgi:hypothetical protein